MRSLRSFAVFAAQDDEGFLESGCARKNAHISLDASMLRLVRPTNHSGICSPLPGQV